MHSMIFMKNIGVIEEYTRSLGGEALSALRIFGEEFAQMGCADRLEVALQRLPCGALVERQRRKIGRIHRGQFSHSEEIGLPLSCCGDGVRLS